jgi:CHAT domain-containing protein
MGILSGIKGILKGGDIVKSVGDVVDNLVTSQEEKEQLKIELQKVINEHEAKIESEVTKRIELEFKDTDSARNREINIATSEKAPLINKIISPLLAILILGSCFLMWYIILFKDIPKEKEIIVAGIVGSLTTLSMAVVGYYFGSSKGAADKDKVITSMANK